MPAARRRIAVLVWLLLAVPGCQGLLEPYPQPLPPNVRISVTPAPGAVVDPAAADTVTLRFSRPMDPASLKLVRRLSFLVPASLGTFDGDWNEEQTRVVFSLDRFPIQAGATYEVLFTGLRTADGVLYNGGPFRVAFHTRGEPDLFPIRPHPRVAKRLFCHRASESDPDCVRASILQASAAGADSLALHRSCSDCGERGRRDLYRRRGDGIEWLGWDVLDSTEAVVRAVRWPVPPVLLGVPTRPGATHAAPAQTSADGTRLDTWRATHVGSDDPVHLLDLGPLPTELAFTGCAVLELAFTLIAAGDAPEHHLERWWLYPGVGLVRRRVTLERPDRPATTELETFLPTLENLTRN